MNVYEVRANLAYGGLVFARSPRTLANLEKQLALWGREFSDWDRRCETIGWIPPFVGNPSRNRAKTLLLDCVHVALGSNLDMLLSTHAREALCSMLTPNGRTLPVIWGDLDYRIFECTTVVDIADQDTLKGDRWDHQNEGLDCWRNVSCWSFHPDRVATAPAIFTVPQWERIKMCTDVLREAVDAHDLLGFEFRLLWSTEGGGVEIDNLPGQFMGESGRQMGIAAKAKYKAMLATLKARAKANRE